MTIINCFAYHSQDQQTPQAVLSCQNSQTTLDWNYHYLQKESKKTISSALFSQQQKNATYSGHSHNSSWVETVQYTSQWKFSLLRCEKKLAFMSEQWEIMVSIPLTSFHKSPKITWKDFLNNS